jgi:hypothetical protein
MADQYYLSRINRFDDRLHVFAESGHRPLRALPA